MENPAYLDKTDSILIQRLQNTISVQKDNLDTYQRMIANKESQISRLQVNITRLEKMLGLR
jgi:hypothetical protein